MIILFFSLIFIVVCSFIGIYLSRNVHTIKGYAVADRSLPLFISTATVFATWFGAEAILGVPESFMENGLVGVISDPIGAFLCLIILGTFFARRFYEMDVITIVDFFYNRYGKLVEILIGIAIAASYIGWIAAQLIAFGGVFSFLLGGSLSVDGGILIGATIITVYTFKGGMLAVAINDFIQAVFISLSLLYMLFIVASMAGGFKEVIDFAIDRHLTSFQFNSHYPNYTFILGVLLSMILGTIPQQDTFQRITSSKSPQVAVLSTFLGGFVYLFITLIPIFIVIAATKLEWESTQTFPEEFNLYIAHFVTEKIPSFVQVFFFGSLFAAILSTASGTILATSVVISRNILREFFPKESNLLAVRLTLVLVTLIISIFSIFTTDSIHELVENSGKVTMVIVFLPLIFGMFWKKTSHKGVLSAIILSGIVWGSALIYQKIYNTKIDVAPEIIGFLTSFFTIVIGSFLFPDSSELRHKIIHHRHMN